MWRPLRAAVDGSDPALAAIRVLVYAVAAFNSIRFSRLELDDALIYARYVQNTIDGLGLVYNPGEYVNGLTSPLYAYAAVVVSWPLGDALSGMMLLCGLLTLAALYSYQRLFALFVPGWLASLGALLMATSAITFINFAMETALFVLLIGETLRLFVLRRYRALLVCAALLILTRPEGMLLLVVLLVAHIAARRPAPRAAWLLLPGALIALHLAFALWYYGSVLPLSGLAKLGQGASGLWGEGSFVYALTHLYPSAFSVAPELRILVWALLTLAALGLAYQSASRLTRLLLPFLILYTGLFHLLNLPPQTWYFGAYFSFLWFYAAAGLSLLLSERRFPRWRRAMITAFVLALAIYQQIQLNDREVGVVAPHYRDAGLWLASHSPPEGAIAAVEIGTLGWYSQRRVVDILGLVTPHNADFVARGDLLAWTERQRPEFVLVHDPFTPLEIGARQLEKHGHYGAVPEFTVAGLRLLRRIE